MGTWAPLVELVTGADAAVVSSPEELAWFEQVLPGRLDPARALAPEHLHLHPHVGQDRWMEVLKPIPPDLLQGVGGPKLGARPPVPASWPLPAAVTFALGRSRCPIPGRRRHDPRS
jgi:hypothetical protein